MKIRKMKYKFNGLLILGLLVVAALVVGAYLLGKHQGSMDHKPNKLITVSDRYKEKLPELEAAAKKNSNDPKARKEYAVALYASGDLEKAKKQYLAEIEANKADTVTYNNLGNIYRQQGNNEEAVKMYQQAITLDEKNAQAYLNLGQLYMHSFHKPDEAIAVYTDALAKNPNNKKIQTQLAIVYERTGDLSNALRIYKDVLEEDLNNIEVRASVKRLEKQL